jgi:hypothetical protein
MIMDSRASAVHDFEQTVRQRRFDAELRRNGGQAFRARRLQCPLSEFRSVNNADCGGVAHRFNWARRSKARDSIAASPTNLAAQSGSLYPTLVGVGRALVARTHTLVWAKRVNFPGGNGFGTSNFAGERGGLSSTLLWFRRTEAPQHWGGLAPSVRSG